jgi:hypothetical protein
MVPKPRIKIAPGTIPIVARTEGNDKIPREIVSAIITEVWRLELCSGAKSW